MRTCGHVHFPKRHYSPWSSTQLESHGRRKCPRCAVACRLREHNALPGAHEWRGIRDQKIETNRYRIHFAGNSSTSRDTVELYLLYHAAELTLVNGYDYFVTTARSTLADTRYYQTVSGGFGYYWFPHTALDVSTTVQPVTEFDAQADIVVFRGKKPEGDLQAFDAREVKANLEPRIQRPGIYR